ncbi:MAG TPA: dihydrofolate reductase family protein [Solirubrobacteraceae bacterium]|nr:dihydrofolate reductase family protein [Solirubrobacteraceae bacterium]
MSKLIYAINASLDGYIEDERGSFDWSRPDHELLAAVNGLERSIGTYLYGRRMYESMAVWETMSIDADQLREQFEPGVVAPLQDFAQLWRVAEKVVYSRTLETVTTVRTRLEREFDAGAVHRLKETSAADITVGGAELASHAMAAGLVDECHLFLHPIIVGGGKRALPDGVRARVRLLDEQRFESGVVHLHYSVET